MATLDDVEIIDFGAHLYPERAFPDPDADALAAGNNVLREHIGPVLSDPAALRDAYERAGIDRAVLSMPYYMGHTDERAVRSANDVLLDVVEGEDAFYGLASIPTGAGGEAAAREFRRALEAGLHGGALETKSAGVELTDGALEGVLEVADRTGAPVLVHPKLLDSLDEAVLSDRYRLNAIFGREAALSESLCKVIHEGVLDRYPDLNLVYHHLGGNVASMLGRIHLQLDPGRWPGQADVLDYPAFEAQLQERIFLDTSGFFTAAAPVRAALEALPASRILFGTDAPFERRTAEELRAGAEQIADLASRSAAAAVLSANARDLLANT